MSIEKKAMLKIVVVSVRNIRKRAANCGLFEFEDFLGKIADTTVISVNSEMPTQRKLHRSAVYLTGSKKIADKFSFFPTFEEISSDTDLVLVVADNPYQLHLLRQLGGWNTTSAKKACVIAELWPPNFSSWRLLKEPFEDYDCVFVGLAEGARMLSERIDVSCAYVPQGVDADVMINTGNPPERVIDFSYPGRRVAALHHQIKGICSENDLFYNFDTALGQELFVDDYKEHRRQYSSLLNRTKYSIALPAKSNVPEQTGGIQEIAYRYFEFTAAGTIVLGAKPNNQWFENNFNWENAIVPLGDSGSAIAESIKDFENDKAYQLSVSNRNKQQALLQHDWVYRFSTMLGQLGLECTSKMQSRRADLAKKAVSLEKYI